jgi:hypothetical protein
MENVNSKPFVVICAWCQKQFLTVDSAVKKESSLGRIRFNHGMCERHFKEEMAPLLSPDKIKLSLEKVYKEGKLAPDLAENPELVQTYSQGNFLPQQSLKERLQKLANIKK